jgi:Holliday junction resolvasome RuvABC ATP-dependent DNA helicase subunit
MPAAPPKMGEADLLDRMSLVAQVFRPAAPIDRRSLFAGRSDQIADVFSVVAQPGQHAVIYGERGVGKTSLAGVTAEMLASANVLTARATCDVSDDFASVWQKSLSEIVIHSTAPALGFTDQIEETRYFASELLGSSVTPDAVRRALQRVAQQQQLAIFIDEFDRLRDPESRVLFADTIKTLSDRVVDVTVFLIGVADSVGDLIREHRSIERALAQIHMPRMASAELAEIATRGIATARMEIAGGAVKKITTLSQGLPHYTQLLTQFAAQAALGRRRSEVTSRDVDAAVTRAIDRAHQSIVEAYRDATVGEQRSIRPQLLLACALAAEDEFGFFAASDARDALGRILGKPPGPAALARQLDELSGEDRGAVLQKHGPAKAARYRFVDPLLQPYVAMRGVSEGVVRVQDLH